MLTFIETKLFTRLADEYLGDEGLLALQVHLLAQPEIGKLIAGSGGVRKLRWAMPGNVSDNISSAVLKKIKATIDG